jgi:hypothetical protein
MGHFNICYTCKLILKLFQRESEELQKRLGLKKDADCGNGYSNVWNEKGSAAV